MGVSYLANTIRDPNALWRRVVPKGDEMKILSRLVSALALFSLCMASLLAQQAATDVAQRASRPAPNLFGKQRPDLPETYGTDQISFIEVPANAFLPWDNTASWTTLDYGRGGRYHTAGAVLDFVAPLHLPAGALVVYLELDGHDSNAAAQVYGSFTACNYYAEGCTYHPATGSSVGNDCTVPGFICSGVAATPGSGVLITSGLAADGIVIDNFVGEYSLLAETKNASDGTVQIGGMIVGYVLQVSPAPGTATFPDVPTSDFGFQYIEALVASGITGGCGGGLYCPDNFVTRRQMAIFIAKALGLHFN